MITLFKFFTLVAVSALGACGVGTFCTAAYLYTGGVAAVDVETAEVDVFVPVPLRIADVALGIAGWAAPDLELSASDRAQLEEFRPLIEEIVDAVGSLPEGELVRVEDGEQLVRVEQRNGYLRVLVDSPEARVQVSVPQRAAKRVTTRALALAGG